MFLLGPVYLSQGQSFGISWISTLCLFHCQYQCLERLVSRMTYYVSWNPKPHTHTHSLTHTDKTWWVMLWGFEKFWPIARGWMGMEQIKVHLQIGVCWGLGLTYYSVSIVLFADYILLTTIWVILPMSHSSTVANVHLRFLSYLAAWFFQRYWSYDLMALYKFYYYCHCYCCTYFKYLL